MNSVNRVKVLKQDRTSSRSEDAQLIRGALRRLRGILRRDDLHIPADDLEFAFEIGPETWALFNERRREHGAKRE